MQNQFRKALLAAAEESAAAGEISKRDLFRLRMATLLPKVCDTLEGECAAQAYGTQLAASDQAIDWPSLAAFLKEMLPVILELIKAIVGLF